MLRLPPWSCFRAPQAGPSSWQRMPSPLPQFYLFHPVNRKVPETGQLLRFQVNMLQLHFCCLQQHRVTHLFPFTLQGHLASSPFSLYRDRGCSNLPSILFSLSILGVHSPVQGQPPPGSFIPDPPCLLRVFMPSLFHSFIHLSIQQIF